MCLYICTHKHACLHTHSFTSTFSLSLKTQHPLNYLCILFFHFYWYFHLNPILFLFFPSVNLITCCFASSHSVTPPAFPPYQIFFYPFFSASDCSRSISRFCFMLCVSVSLPHNTPNHPRDRACLLCLFNISALCSCDGNLSFKYLFLPSPDFFFFFRLPHCRHHHQRTPHSIPEILNCASSNLAPGHFKTCHLQFRSTHWDRASEPGTPARQAVILLLRNSIKLHAVHLCFGSLSAANQLAMPVTITGLCIAKELQMMMDCYKNDISQGK